VGWKLYIKCTYVWQTSSWKPPPPSPHESYILLLWPPIVSAAIEVAFLHSRTFYWCFHCTKCGWNASMLFRVVIMCCWMSLSENWWLCDVLSSGYIQGQIWWCGERFYFVSAVSARKLLYSKHVIRRNYSLENIGGVACHWWLQSTWTVAWCLGVASLAVPFTMCFVSRVFGQKIDNEIGPSYLPDLAQCEFWLFYFWRLLWRAIDFWHFWHQEE